MAVDQYKYQWDFKTYYYAGLAYADGRDPYYLRELSSVAREEIGFPYAYPPITLPIARIISFVDFDAAYLLFLALKTVVLICLVVFWRVKFLEGETSSLFYLFCLLGFGGSAYVDLTSGNIAVFEQLGLWVAFLALIRGRLWVFSGLIVVVGIWKLLPIAFALLILLSPKKSKYAFLASIVTVSMIIHAVGLVIWPGLSGSFFRVATQLDSRGALNPSTLALARDITDWLARTGLRITPVLSTATYVMLAGFVLLVTVRGARRAQSGTVGIKPVIFLACLAFALAAPRMKDYSYILLLLPSYYFLTHLPDGVAWRIAVLVPMLSTRLPIPFDTLKPAAQLFWSYYPLLTALSVWLIAGIRLGSMNNLTRAPHAAGTDLSKHADGDGRQTAKSPDPATPA